MNDKTTTDLSIVDIGANLTNKRFRNDLDDVLARAKSNHVDKIILTGTDATSSQSALDLSKAYPNFLYSTTGVHPHHASDWTPALSQLISKLAYEKSVVAIGECGLDFNRNFSTPEEQVLCFEAQLEIAVEKKMPVFLHERDAHERFTEILGTFVDQLSSTVVHCFTGSKTELKAYLDLDCYIGITGWVCDERRGDSLREAVTYIPKDRLMVETDAPYLLPRTLKSKPKNGRNEPAFLHHVVQELARLRGESEGLLCALTTQNALRFFGI